MIKRALPALVLLVLTGSAVYFWQTHNSQSAPLAGTDSPGEFALPVEAAGVQQQTLLHTISTVGSLLADEEVTLRPELEGRVAEIHFREGQRVQHDELLLSLDAAIYRAELSQAEARLALSRANHTRVTALREKGLSSEQEVDQAISQLRVDQATLILARTQLEKMAIHAPFDGVIGLRSVSVGDYLIPGQAIATLVRSDPVKLDFRVAEVHLAKVRIGQTVEVRVDAYPDELFTGEVYAMEPRVDINGRSFRVRAQIPNPDHRLQPGLFAQVRLLLERRENALLISEEALMPQGDQQFVYRIVDGKAMRTEVTTGLRQERSVEVTTGLEPGDRVITAGQMKLSDGTPVQPLPED